MTSSSSICYANQKNTTTERIPILIQLQQEVMFNNGCPACCSYVICKELRQSDMNVKDRPKYMCQDPGAAPHSPSVSPVLFRAKATSLH